MASLYKYNTDRVISTGVGGGWRLQPPPPPKKNWKGGIAPALPITAVLKYRFGTSHVNK